MQHYWLNRSGNDKLILFFAGWGFDENPFKFLNCGEYDVLMFYDYNDLQFIDIPDYKEINLIAWSMGVFVASLLREKLPPLNKKIAVNGTLFPVHDEWGIPVKIFELTLKHAQAGLQGKFYKNVFGTNFEQYAQNPVARTIENRVDELNSLYELIKNSPSVEASKTFYDLVIVSDDDKIIPTNNQLAFWGKNSTPHLVVSELKFASLLSSPSRGEEEYQNPIETGHFPFYNYQNWSDIINAG